MEPVQNTPKPVSNLSSNLPLNPNEILIAEYNFAANSAFQANEDRIKVFSYFLANIGTLIAAIALPAFTNVVSYTFFAGVFLLLFVVGILTLLQLVKVRQAWYESAKAMNQIKDYYVDTFQNLNFSKAFKWRSTNIPKPDKLFTIAYLLGLTTMLLNSVSLGTALFLFVKNEYKLDLLLPAIFVGLAVLLIQNIIWFSFLKE